MRLRSVVVPVVAACAAALAVPSAADAGSEQCTLVMPTKVVVDVRAEKIPVRFAANCERAGAVAAQWDVAHSSGEYWKVEFDEETATSSLTQMDDDAVGRYVGNRGSTFTAEGVKLTQNRPLMYIKYDSTLETKVTRTSTSLTWAVTAKQWSGRAHANVPRPKVTVGLFHQTSSSAAWTYVKSVTTSSTGKATVSLGALKTGNYRLKVAETPTVWAAYSSTIRGKI